MSTNKLIKSSVFIIILSIISKLLGFIRESFVAANFGASYSSDIYIFSMSMTGLLFASIGAGLTTTFIPMLTDYIYNKDKKQTNYFINNVISLTVVSTIVLMVLAIIFSEAIVYAFAPGFKGDLQTFRAAVLNFRIIVVSILFIGLQNALRGVLQAHNEFIETALTTVMSNLVLLLYFIFFCEKYGLLGLGIATILSYFTQFIIQVPKYNVLGYKYRFFIDFKDSDIRRMFKMMIPVIIGTSIFQINLLIDRTLASTVGEGSIAILNFANKLNMFIYAIFALAITTVVFPNMSIFLAKNDIEGYKNSIIKSINVVLLLMIPAAVGMIILREQLINIIFKRGAFDELAAEYTASVLIYYTPSMVFFGTRDLLNKAFYSLKDTKTPMYNSVAGIALNIIMNLILISKMGVSGLALATTISAFFTSVLLVISLKKKIRNFSIRKIIDAFIKISVSSTIMGIVIYKINLFCLMRITTGIYGSIISLLLSMIIGTIVYLICIYLLKVDELLYLIRLVKSRKVKNKV